MGADGECVFPQQTGRKTKLGIRGDQHIGPSHDGMDIKIVSIHQLFSRKIQSFYTTLQIQFLFRNINYSVRQRTAVQPDGMNFSGNGVSQDFVG